MKLDQTFPLAREQVDRTRSVRQGVLDQVSQRLLDARAVREYHSSFARGNRDLPPGRGRPRRESIGSLLEQSLDLDRPGTDGEAALIGIRNQQQILGQRGQPLCLLSRRPERCLELRSAPRTPQRQLELRSQQRERGPQLVARVRDKPPFVLD